MEVHLIYDGLFVGLRSFRYLFQGVLPAFILSEPDDCFLAFAENSNFLEAFREPIAEHFLFLLGQKIIEVFARFLVAGGHVRIF